MPNVKVIILLCPPSSSTSIDVNDIYDHPLFIVVLKRELKGGNQDIAVAEPFVTIEIPLFAWPLLGTDYTTLAGPHCSRMELSSIQAR